MRGNVELEAWGAASLRKAHAVFVGSGHIRGVLEEVVGQIDRVHEVPPGVDVEQFVLSDRETALAGLLAEARADPPNPGNVQERLPDEGNAARIGEVPPRRRADGSLLREAPLQQRRPRAARGDARRGRAHARRRVRRLPPRARADRAAADALHGAARASAPRAPDPARRRLRRALDLPGGVRNGGRRGRGGGLPAARRAPLGPGGGRRGDRGGVPARVPAPRELRDRRLARSRRQAARAARAARGHAPGAGEAARGVAVEKWSWAGVAARLLEPFKYSSRSNG